MLHFVSEVAVISCAAAAVSSIYLGLAENWPQISVILNQAPRKSSERYLPQHTLSLSPPVSQLGPRTVKSRSMRGLAASATSEQSHASADRSYFKRRSLEEIKAAMRADCEQAAVSHIGLAELHLKRCVASASGSTDECEPCMMANVC